MLKNIGVFLILCIVVTVALAVAAWALQSPALGWAAIAVIGLSAGAVLVARRQAGATASMTRSSRPPQPTPPHVARDDRAAPPGQGWPIVQHAAPPVPVLPPAPDLAPLYAVMTQHRGAYTRYAEHPDSHDQDLEQHRQGVHAAFAWNLEQIQPYLDDVLAREDPARLAGLPTEIRSAAELLSIGCWCVGHAFRAESPSASTLLLMARGLSLAALPIAQRDLVESAIANAHRLFVSIFQGYYASEHGRAVQRQRDGHFLDVYGTFTRAALRSFQLGLDARPDD